MDISDVRVGMKLTNGKVTLTVVFVDHSGVFFDNGYCPNKYEIKQWSLV